MALASENKNVRKSSEDWLPVKNIENSTIITYGNNKVSGVKITPKNIFILDDSSQNSVLISLKNFYNMIDFEFWLVVADRPVDISIYISQLQLELNSTPNQAIRKLILQDIEKCNTFINNNVVDTEYYATCGLNAKQVSNDDLRVILDNFLNGGQTTEFGTVIPV